LNDIEFKDSKDSEKYNKLVTILKNRSLASFGIIFDEYVYHLIMENITWIKRHELIFTKEKDKLDDLSVNGYDREQSDSTDLIRRSMVSQIFGEPFSSGYRQKNRILEKSIFKDTSGLIVFKIFVSSEGLCDGDITYSETYKLVLFYGGGSKHETSL